jgi:hypothetical protein
MLGVQRAIAGNADLEAVWLFSGFWAGIDTLDIAF